LKAALCPPDLELGPPPAPHARAGRMNAQGISVFYGANAPSVAIAEVRPPVGSQVALAELAIVKPLRLLDLTALRAVRVEGSVFDPGLAGRMERAMFLRSLSQHITRPVMPDDEVFEYLATQAVANFLATESEIPLDGILFPSVQAAGNVLNVVFFHKAARVEPLVLPEGTEVRARTGHIEEEGWEIEYEVIESVPPPQPALPVEMKKPRWPPNFADILAMSPADPEHELDDGHDDWREPSLRVVIESVKVHVVQRVQVETDEFDVTRRRRDKEPS
jgi:hypothetical protein